MNHTTALLPKSTANQWDKAMYCTRSSPRSNTLERDRTVRGHQGWLTAVLGHPQDARQG